MLSLYQQMILFLFTENHSRLQTPDIIQCYVVSSPEGVDAASRYPQNPGTINVALTTVPICLKFTSKARHNMGKVEQHG
jgi:hypothetical protein